MTNTTRNIGPLRNIRVIELGQVIAGPFCGQMLGDFGADVIKIEPPRTGDVLRQWGAGDDPGGSVWWQVAARNKRSVTIDLRTEEGQQLVADLVADADVLIENFRPGTLEKWNLGWEKLHALNPRLILVRVSGYGQTGPYAKRPGYAAVGEAMGGLRSLTGYPDRPPVRVGVSLGDSLAGLFAALGTLAALEDRHTTGLGQIVDASIYESVLAVTESLVAEWSALERRRERTGPILPGIAPSNIYPASDGDVIIAANQDTIFARLCEAMGQPTLITDDRFIDHRARGQRQAELDNIVASWTKQRSAADVLAALHAAAVPAGLLFQPADMLTDEHFQARKSIIDIETQGYGTVSMQNAFPALSSSPGGIRWPGQPLGEATTSVLKEILGLSMEKIAHLQETGIVGYPTTSK